MFKIKIFSLILLIALFSTQASMAAGRPAQTESFKKKVARVLILTSLLLTQVLGAPDEYEKIKQNYIDSIKTEYRENAVKINLLQTFRLGYGPLGSTLECDKLYKRQQYLEREWETLGKKFYELKY